MNYKIFSYFSHNFNMSVYLLREVLQSSTRQLVISKFQANPENTGNHKFEIFTGIDLFHISSNLLNFRNSLL